MQLVDMKVQGLNTVLKNMRRASDKLSGSYSRGLKRAGALVLRRSQKIVPVEWGNLKGSGFVRALGEGFHTKVVIGYTAEYAIYVHENTNAAHGEEYNRKYAREISAHLAGYHRRGKDQQAKFLEKAFLESIDDILRIMHSEMSKTK